MTTLTSNTNRIAILNDRCRQGLDRTARIVVTRACLATIAGDGKTSDGNSGSIHVAEILAQATIMAELRKWQAPEGDRSERDLGWFQVGVHKLMFKIDYYDPDLKYGSEDPADAARTIRVLTIMLPGDY